MTKQIYIKAAVLLGFLDLLKPQFNAVVIVVKSWLNAVEM